jgi:hypothetical protein
LIHQRQALRLELGSLNGGHALSPLDTMTTILSLVMIVVKRLAKLSGDQLSECYVPGAAENHPRGRKHCSPEGDHRPDHRTSLERIERRPELTDG